MSSYSLNSMCIGDLESEKKNLSQPAALNAKSAFPIFFF